MTKPFRPHSLYAAFPVAVALVVVVDAGFIRSWQVPEEEPVVIQIYPKQHKSVATLHDSEEDKIRNFLRHN